MKHAKSIFALLATAGLITAAHATTTGADTTDKTFVDKAGQSGATEIEASKLALKNTSNTAVKQFAQRMIDDHTQLAADLKTAASKEGLTPPDTPDSAVIHKLTPLQGAAFDKTYIQEVAIKGHKDAVDLFSTEANNGSSKTLKEAASKSLPKIKHHLEMAEKLAASKP